MGKAFRIGSDIHQTTAGGGIEIDTYIVKGKDVREQFGNAELTGSFVLTYDGARPGVDYPFSSELYSLFSPTSQSTWKKRKVQNQLRAGSSSDGLVVNTAVLSSPPDTTPLFMRIIEGDLLKKFKVFRAYGLFISDQAFGDARGYWSEFIPANAYGGTSCQILEEIQRHMLEPVIDEGASWQLWTQDEVLGFLNDRIQRWLLETSLIESQETISVTSGFAEYDLPTDLIAIQRLAITVSGTSTGLIRVDKFQLDNGLVGWQDSTGTPYAYIVDPTNPLSISLYPEPDANCSLDLLYTADHPTIGTTCSLINLPTYSLPFIKYGVMADMLSKQGEANDPKRAVYCERRFQEGIELIDLMMGRK